MHLHGKKTNPIFDFQRDDSGPTWPLECDVLKLFCDNELQVYEEIDAMETCVVISLYLYSQQRGTHKRKLLHPVEK